MAETLITAPPAGVSPNPGTSATKAAAPGQTAHRFGFHDLLSALNPLQYIPVVGTIYRTATGDVIPDDTRMAGSMVLSFLTGGPAGVAGDAAVSVLEKITGIDPEKIGHTLLARLGIGPRDAPAATPALAAAAPAAPTVSDSAALTAHQLAAYGVHTNASGDLAMGSIQGADVLNTIELHQLAFEDQERHMLATSAYAAAQRPAAPDAPRQDSRV